MSFRKDRIFGACGAVLACWLAGGAMAEIALDLSGERLRDELNNEALISGNWLVGAHIMAPKTDIAPVLLSHVPGGAGWQGQRLCARATDKSGRYSALFEYTLPNDWQGGLVNFIYQSDHQQFLKATDENNNGIALHLGACHTISETFLPVHWNSQETPTAYADGRVELVLNLNMGRADSLKSAAWLIPEQGAGKVSVDIACAPTDTMGVGFNYQCRLLVPGDLAGAVEVSLVRLRYGKASPPRVARIQFYPAGTP